MKTISCNLDPLEGITPKQIRKQAAKVLQCRPGDLGPTVLKQQSLDVRGRYPVVHCNVEVYDKEEQPASTEIHYKDVSPNGPAALVVGAGPAGLFAALTLLEQGIKPIILERGKDIHARKMDIALVNKGLGVNPDSNFCFGEGGAGTFSDGKLYTRSTKRGDVGAILRTLVAHGASESILSQAHAHIGSDKLPAIMERLRHTLVSHGGEYHFETRVVDFLLEKTTAGKSRVVGVIDANGREWTANAVLLATGHSAREMYRLFAQKGWALEAQGFALGVRVEHPQALINRIQYARVAPSHLAALPPATYSLIEQVNGRGVFSFCMCPGGMVVPSSSQEDGLVLNGMSNSQRSGLLANAGVVVSLSPADAPQGPLEMLHLQEAIERAAQVGGPRAPFVAPAQRMTDFVRGRISANLPASSYRPGCLEAPLHALLPPYVTQCLQKAFPAFDKKMHGYYTQDALLLGVETRTSSPVRLTRDKETLQHITLEGLYPCGEGAGYAGGIVSSAVDGSVAAAAAGAAIMAAL